MPLSRFIWPSNETIKTRTQLLAVTSSTFHAAVLASLGPGQNGQVLQLYTGSLGLVLGEQGSTLPNHHLTKLVLVRCFGKVIKTWSRLLTPRAGLGWALHGAPLGSRVVIYFPCNSWKAELWNQGSFVLYKYRSLWFLLFCAWFVDFCKTNTEDWSV